MLHCTLTVLRYNLLHELTYLAEEPHGITHKRQFADVLDVPTLEGRKAELT